MVNLTLLRDGATLDSFTLESLDGAMTYARAITSAFPAVTAQVADGEALRIFEHGQTAALHRVAPLHKPLGHAPGG